MNTLFQIILATTAITLCVWVTLPLLMLKKDLLKRITLFLVALSAGSFMGGAFLHILPEATENLEAEKLFGIVLISFVSFFLLEKLLHWRHCHKGECSVHSFGYMNLVGDSVHNFIDGLIIASTFMIDPKLGLITTFAIALHEIPQEVGDFGVLIHAGFKRKKALIINYLVALMVVFGGITGYIISSKLESALPMLLPLAAGGFIYIASSDLMPEIRNETNFKKSILSLLFFLLGILLMLALTFLE